MALRIASFPSARWSVKAAERNPELSSKYRTNRAIGRPRRRCKDDINEFIKLEENETENSVESNNQLNKSWINAAKDSGRWRLYSKTITQCLQEKELKVVREPEEILKVDQQDTSMEWDWATTKWPTSHNTKIKEKIKVKIKSEAFLGKRQQLRNQLRKHILRVAKLWSHASARVKRSRTSWWIDHRELRDGLNRM